ncbi:MAG: MFS transporter [Bacteroidia bacterium]|nr:MFS transporter [Bacteroidia bacterium]MCZ2249635.1 MFS transporter [Bacteroidia bacterium]
MNQTNQLQQTNYKALTSLVTVFFFWGFVAASNDILIPVFKSAFSLTQRQSQLVSFAFYIAYTVGSIIYMLISLAIKQDLINKMGYKNSLALGLFISALGTLLFYPAANLHSYPLMLMGLFVVALGFSLQQTVANPLAISLGPHQTGANRLTLAGGINNFGTSIGPLIISYAIFGSSTNTETTMNIEGVKIPYLILGIAFLLVALMLKFSKIPNHPDDVQEDVKRNEHDRKSALQYPQLVLGMIAIFVYVGVEVSTASNLPYYMEQKLHIETQYIAPYISLYWASLMIGRWSGAVEVLSAKKEVQRLLKIVMPYLAFAAFLLINIIAGHNLAPFYMYAGVIILLIIADMMSNGNPIRMLLLFSIMGALGILVGMNAGGMISVYAFTSVGLFCSTLWPCIFALAISGLGKNTSQGSSFLIMMIMGGGVVSWIQGYVADKTDIETSYWVGVICFLYLIFYAIAVKRILHLQGISYETNQLSH